MQMQEERKIPAREEIRSVRVKRHTQEVQEKLERAHVAIAGLGGLGSNISLSLLRIGVGHLHLIDMDEVDLSNINRQQYRLRQVGMLKTDALKEELLDIDPYADIKTTCVRIDETNMEELFAGYCLRSLRRPGLQGHAGEFRAGEAPGEIYCRRLGDGRLRQEQ